MGRIFECAWPSWISNASGPDVKGRPRSVIMRGPAPPKGSKDPQISSEELGDRNIGVDRSIARHRRHLWAWNASGAPDD